MACVNNRQAKKQAKKLETKSERKEAASEAAISTSKSRPNANNIDPKIMTDLSALMMLVKQAPIFALATLITVVSGDLQTTRSLIGNWVTMFCIGAAVKAFTICSVQLALEFDPSRGKLDWEQVKADHQKDMCRNIFKIAASGAERLIIAACILRWPGSLLFHSSGFAHCLDRSLTLMVGMCIFVRVRKALKAMYRLKVFYDSWKTLDNGERVAMEEHVKEALEDERFGIFQVCYCGKCEGVLEKGWKNAALW